MAQLIRLVLAVAADKLADIIDAAQAAGATMTLANGELAAQLANGDDAAHEAAVDAQVAAANRRSRTATVATQRAERAPLSAAGVTRRNDRQPTTRIGRRVLYTPIGKKRDIDAMLAELKGQNTMKAFVLRDLAKHPGSLNREVRERIQKDPTAKKLIANGQLSIESVDNVVWQLVKAGKLSKAAAE